MSHADGIHSGGDKPYGELPVSNKDANNAAVVIIGGGISGICTAIDLITRHNCHNFVILEKSAGVGGTWKDNKYPGCSCDVWSILYSYSFEQRNDWTREFPGQEEVLDYLIGVAQKYNLYRYCRFNSEVTSAKWDDGDKKWKTTVKLAKGSKESEFREEYTLRSDFLVSAVGQLNQPSYPNIPGLDDFKGKMLHSARWDWEYDIRGQRVAVIGNGSTAAQIIPEVAKTASHLQVYMRTPNWVIPRMDAPISDFWKRLYAVFPPLRWRERATKMSFRESTHVAITDGDSDMAQEFKDLSIEMMKESFPDQPDMWEKLTPKYKVGCKRIVLSDDFYSALARDNVTLDTRSIQAITETGIRTKDQQTGEENLEEFDLIVLATGFRTLEFMHPINVTGRNGTSLADVWKGGALGYKGVTVPELPNFGILYGPNTNLGHNSIILMIESQSRYITALARAAIDARQRGDPVALVPRDSKVKEYNDDIQHALQNSSFADPSCNSWYKNPETGRITNNWSGTVVEYQKRLYQLDWDDYEDGEKVKRMRNGEDKKTTGRVVEELLIPTKALVAISALAVGAGIFAGNYRSLSGLLRS